MNPILAGVAVGIATTMLSSLFYGLLRRFSLKTKTEERIEEIKEDLEALSAGQHLLFKLILPLLLTARDGKTNGELKEALRLYNEYMQSK